MNFIFAAMEYFKIGKLVAVHGLKGELLLKHELGKKTTLKGLRAIFTEEKKNSFLPWFIETTKLKSAEELILKLETIESREAAIKLVQKEIWLPEADFKLFAAKNSPVNLLGYTMLVPLHEEFLQKIDHNKKQVIVTLPEGLLEIYL